MTANEYQQLAMRTCNPALRGINLLLNGVMGLCGEAGEVIDAKGLLAIPGLVDVHSHGAVGYDFCDGTHESIDAITRYEASRGVTAWCGTTMTFPEEKLAGIMECAAEHTDASDAAALVGINMEGPFISPEKVGAQNPATVRCGDVPSPAECIGWQNQACRYRPRGARRARIRRRNAR